MTSNIYDNDCSIIKQPVTIDEFRKEIDLLKEEIANLKKGQNKFIIDLVEFDEIDKQIEEEYKDFLLNIKSLFNSNKWEIVEHGSRKFKGIKIKESDFYDYHCNKKIKYYFNRRHLYFVLCNDKAYLVKDYTFYNGNLYGRCDTNVCFINFDFK